MVNGVDHLKRVDLPNLLQRFLRPGDILKQLSRSGGAVLIEHSDALRLSCQLPEIWLEEVIGLRGGRFRFRPD